MQQQYTQLKGGGDRGPAMSKLVPGMHMTIPLPLLTCL